MIAMSFEKEKPAEESMNALIHLVRGKRVILDSDLARLYASATSRFNEAFKRILLRFPEDFAFQLTQEEISILRSQNAISKSLDSKVKMQLVNRGRKTAKPQWK